MIDFITQIRPQCVITYKSYPTKHKVEGLEPKEPKPISENLKKGKSGEYNGYMSKQTTKYVKRILSVWIESCQENKHPLIFLTLTLSSKQIHDDNTIKRELLNPFIIWLKEEKKAKNYFWRAEPQKNGNIHFHIITDIFINANELNTKWNKLQNKLGYIDRYAEKQKEKYKHGFFVDYGKIKTQSIEKQAEIYKRAKACGFTNAPSTHLVQLDFKKNAIAYVCKYVTKSGKYEPKNEVGSYNKKQYRTIDGRIWGCSDELRNLKYYAEFAYSEIGSNEEICKFTDELEKLDKEEVTIKRTSDFTVYILKKNIKNYYQKMSSKLYREVINHYNFYYDKLYKSNVQTPV